MKTVTNRRMLRMLFGQQHPSISPASCYSCSAHLYRSPNPRHIASLLFGNPMMLRQQTALNTKLAFNSLMCKVFHTLGLLTNSSFQTDEEQGESLCWCQGPERVDNRLQCSLRERRRFCHSKLSLFSLVRLFRPSTAAVIVADRHDHHLKLII